ncbi:uncharacterized protein LOC125673601 [Ostrea edulis]|uniref:uncharacterized protein LOC125673601 n=1 Tax=Ostrea edulis TaxID=37623 RepID=UPI0024AE92BA|nr:uncharacterized protein LOC125673601 [Ostrea edulis]
MCTYVARAEDDYKKHVLQCAMRTFNCTYYNYNSNKETNVKRYERRSHPGMTEEPIKLDGKRDNAEESTRCSSKSVEVQNAEQSEEEWLKQDYGDVIGNVSTDSGDSSDEGDTRDDHIRQEENAIQHQSLEGRVIRKPTIPAKPYAPQNKIPLFPSKPEVASKETNCKCRKRKLSMEDVGVQTEVSKRIVVTRQIKRFREGGIDVEEVREETFEY